MKAQTFYEVVIPAKNFSQAQAIMEELPSVGCPEYYPVDDYSGEVVYEHLTEDEYNLLINSIEESRL